jgi:hypothetical protein
MRRRRRRGRLHTSRRPASIGRRRIRRQARQGCGIIVVLRQERCDVDALSPAVGELGSVRSYGGVFLLLELTRLRVSSNR